MYEKLNKINSPKDLKNLTPEQLAALSDEIRQLIIYKVNQTGGHFGPNLGMVEATVALHYVFNSPEDKVVFDVSHQCYAHKILTGRKENFLNPAKYAEICGYTNPAESEHDQFFVGHTSTSVSLATGLAKARDAKGEKHNVIAILGDGSLSGGEALEGLDAAAELKSNIIIIINDNEMSIAPTAGGLYQNLALLRQTNGQAENNFFKAWGFEYVYVENGNNVSAVVAALKQVKDTPRPMVVHIHTLKGKGCKEAETNKEMFHFIAPHTLDPKAKNTASSAPTYTGAMVDYILKKSSQDKSVVTISAATPSAYGLLPDVRAKLGKQFVDVGIAEEHAVAFASGLAKGGAKPIFPVLSSFVQRTYDQLSQDLALNKNAATLIVCWAGITPADATHLGVFDIPLISNIPNIIYLAPTNVEEFIAMVDWAVEQTAYPVAVRMPAGPLVHATGAVETDYSRLNTFKVTRKGQKVAIIGAGTFFELGKQVHAQLKTQLGIEATLINPRYLSGVDEKLLTDLQKDHQLVITLEDGVLEGGFGQKVAAFYGKTPIKVLNFGAGKEFTDREALDSLYKRFHLTPDLIVADIQSVLK